MSIIQELYGIFDREQAKYLERKGSKNLVVLELSGNLAFLREGLAEKLDATVIIQRLADSQYRTITEKGIELNAIRKKPLAKSTCDGVREFEKYLGWSTERLINNAYERIDTLKRLNVNRGHADLDSRLKYLFKYLMMLMAHIKGEQITLKQ